MAIADDFSVSVNGDIRYTGSGDNYTVLELYRFLNNLADNATSSGDDLLDIDSPTPSNKSTDNIITLINGYNIDDTASQHIYDGSITQDGGDTIYEDVRVIAPSGTYVQVLQNGDVVSPNFWTTGINPDAEQSLSHRFMIKVRTGGADIDGRRLIVTGRELGSTFKEFSSSGTVRGNNVFSIPVENDLNNQTAEGTIAGWNTITNTEGYRPIDVDGDGSVEHYYSEWDKDIYTINQLYERTKWLTRRGTSSTLYGLDGNVFRGITHDITVDNPTGTFVEPESVSWTGGTGQLLAINSTTAPTRMWIQLLTGVAPTDGQTITGNGGATCDVDTTVIERTVPTPFFGVSTGSAIIGGYGVGVEAADLGASDSVFDLDNNQVTPPNNVTFTVSNLVIGDQVLVAPEDGSGGLDRDQLSLNTTLNGAAETAVVVTTTIPSDTPTSGTIRVVLDSGTARQVSYTSFTGSTFTIPSTDFSGGNAATAGNDVYISYIDKTATSTSESFTVVYNADRDLFIRVRNGSIPIKPFETTGTLGTAGGSSTTIRTSDA